MEGIGRKCSAPLRKKGKRKEGAYLVAKCSGRWMAPVKVPRMADGDEAPVKVPRRRTADGDEAGEFERVTVTERGRGRRRRRREFEIRQPFG